MEIVNQAMLGIIIETLTKHDKSLYQAETSPKILNV